MRRALFAALVACAAVVTVSAQPVTTVTNLAALTAYPDFYVDRTVVARGQVRTDATGRVVLDDGAGHRVASAWNSADRPDGFADITGVLWDVGRMKQDDPRLAGYDLSALVGAGRQDWPLPGQMFVLAVQKFVPADTRGVTPPTIRTLVLEGPAAGSGEITVSGQFAGRNLFGDLPRAPGLSRWDFVVRSAGAAIWVTGMQPSGRDFDFDPDKRIDSNRWLQVTGRLREARGLMVIQATKLTLSKPELTEPVDAVAQPKPVPPAAPPIILFSVPVDGQQDVPTTTVVRIQLSRTLDRASLAKRVRAGYLATPTQPAAGIISETDLEERNDAPSGAIAVLRISFPRPLDRFRTVKIELLEGITATDGQPLKPWQMTFTVGAQ